MRRNQSRKSSKRKEAKTKIDKKAVKKAVKKVGAKSSARTKSLNKPSKKASRKSIDGHKAPRKKSANKGTTRAAKLSSVEIPARIVSPFSVTVREINRLGPLQAVTAVRDLLLAEAPHLGIPIKDVIIPLAINDPDGGIDAEIRGSVSAKRSGLLCQGKARYQIKAGDFSISSEKDIKSLLLTPNSARKKLGPQDLKPRVKECFDDNGTFFALIFGNEIVDRKANAAEKKIREFLKNKIGKEYRNAKIKIIDANGLAAAFSCVPGLTFRIKEIEPVESFVHDRNWMEWYCDFDKLPTFLKSEGHQTAIDQIVSKSRIGGSFRHIRLVGEPGIGKTRLVFEALADPYLAPLVVYCQDATQVINAGIVEKLRFLASQGPMILVVDECDISARDEFHNHLHRTDMTLITIYNQSDVSDRDSRFFLLDAPRLGDDEIRKIIESYHVDSERAKLLSVLCEGSPRVAHGVGKTLRSAPQSEQLFNVDSLDEIWNLYLMDSDSRRDEQFDKRITVLRCVALFKRFGWLEEYQDEAKAIWSKVVHQVDQNISWANFNSAIEYFSGRRVLQGKSTLYISPKLLHIKLWCDWWSKCAPGIDNVVELLNSMPEQLSEWMAEMFVYARESRAATNVVNKILDESGLYSSIKGFDTVRSSSLFFQLAQVNPKAALRRISQALGPLSLQERRQFSDGRHSVVNALRHISVFQDCFLEAAQCLLLLAEAENESWANNASGVFSELFTLGAGPLASTELDPIERLPYLLEVLSSDSQERRALAISAFNRSFDEHQYRVSLGDVYGLRAIPVGWKPATYGELWGAYLKYVEVAFQKVPELPQSDADKMVDAILSHARSLIHIKPIASVFPTMLGDLANKLPRYTTSIVQTLVSIFRYEISGLHDEVVFELRALYEKLANSSFAARLRRYVMLDLIEDKFNESGEHEDRSVLEIPRLVEEVMADRDLLLPELAWLNTPAAKNSYLFGQQIAAKDADLSIWKVIKESWMATESPSDLFVGGYLAGLYAANKKSWENELLAIAGDNRTKKYFPFVLWRSGMTRNMALLLLRLAKCREIEPSVVRIYIYGAVVKSIPFDILVKFIEILLSCEQKEDIAAAIDVLFAILRTGRRMTGSLVDLCFRALGHRSLFIENNSVSPDTMLDYNWKEIAKALFQANTKKGLQLAKIVVQSFGKKGTIFAAYLPQSLEFLHGVVKQCPMEMWDVISTCITPPLDERAWNLLLWMRGGLGGDKGQERPVFELFPHESILSWIQPDPKMRALVIAQFMPPIVTGGKFQESLAYAVIHQYGQIKEVRSAFHANYNTGMWMGPASQHLKQKRNELSVALAQEKKTNLRRWLTEQISSLDQMIEKEEMREERESFR